MPFVQIQLRRGTAAEWLSTNPVLAVGEMVLETDTNQFKIGNGISVWTALPYGGVQGATGFTGATGAGTTGSTGSTGTPGYTVVSDYFSVVGSLNGSGNTVAYTYDGINYFASTSGKTVFTFACTCGNGTNRLGYSSDGINWSVSTSGNSVFPDGYILSLAWNGSLWVAGS